MAAQRIVALLIAVLLSLSDIGSCLQCYECSTAHDPSCKDPFTRTHKHARLCVMDGQCGKTTIETPGGVVIVRQCFNPMVNCKNIGSVTKAFGIDEKIKSCHACNGDFCNGGTSISSSFALTIVLLATSLYYMK